MDGSRTCCSYDKLKTAPNSFCVVPALRHPQAHARAVVARDSPDSLSASHRMGPSAADLAHRRRDVLVRGTLISHREALRAGGTPSPLQVATWPTAAAEAENLSTRFGRSACALSHWVPGALPNFRRPGPAARRGRVARKQSRSGLAGVSITVYCNLAVWSHVGKQIIFFGRWIGSFSSSPLLHASSILPAQTS